MDSEGLVVGRDLSLPWRSVHGINCSRNLGIEIRRRNHGFGDFEYAELVGRGYDGLVRSYDVGVGIVLCKADNIQILIEVKGGRIEVLSPDEELPEALLYALGLCMSACTNLRQIPTLHAAAIGLQEGSAIGIMAQSGVGKSSLLWSFLSQGANYVSDDCLPLRTSQNEVLGIPSFLPSKLWIEDIQRIGIDMDKCERLLEGGDKYWVPVAAHSICTRPVPIQALFELAPSENIKESDGVSVRILSTTEAGLALLANTHGLWMLPRRICGELLRCYADLSTRIPIYRLEYFRTEAVTELINSTIKAIALRER